MVYHNHCIIQPLVVTTLNGPSLLHIRVAVYGPSTNWYCVCFPRIVLCVMIEVGRKHTYDDLQVEDVSCVCVQHVYPHTTSTHHVTCATYTHTLTPGFTFT